MVPLSWAGGYWYCQLLLVWAVLSLCCGGCAGDNPSAFVWPRHGSQIVARGVHVQLKLDLVRHCSEICLHMTAAGQDTHTCYDAVKFVPPVPLFLDHAVLAPTRFRSEVTLAVSCARCARETPSADGTSSWVDSSGECSARVWMCLCSGTQARRHAGTQARRMSVRLCSRALPLLTAAFVARLGSDIQVHGGHRTLPRCQRGPRPLLRNDGEGPNG
jgi:hypothetical protein